MAFTKQPLSDIPEDVPVVFHPLGQMHVSPGDIETCPSWQPQKQVPRAEAFQTLDRRSSSVADLIVTELERYQDSEEEDNSGLAVLTEDTKAAFRNAHPDQLTCIWDAMYASSTDHWSEFMPHPALQETLETYSELFTGAMPRLSQLSDWFGHGFGWDSTQTEPSILPGAMGTKRKKALVPGFGNGADLALLAKLFGYDVVGIDFSSNAYFQAEEALLDVDDLICGRFKPMSDSQSF